MFCPNCRTQATGTERWCIACGAALGAVVASTRRADGATATSTASRPDHLAGLATIVSGPHAEALVPGARVGPGNRYELDEIIGRGSTGVVHRARDHERGVEVAIKVVLPRVANDAATRKRLIEVVRKASGLRHDNLAAVHDVHEVDDLLLIVMDLVPATALRDTLRLLAGAGRTMSPDRTRDIARQVLAALAFIHPVTAHGDMRPANLLLAPTNDGERVKLIDVGYRLAIAREHWSVPESDAAVSTPLAPEVAAGGEPSRASDLHGIGAIMHLCLTRQPPGPESGASLAGAGASPALQSLMALMLSPRPAERPSAAAALEAMGSC